MIVFALALICAPASAEAQAAPTSEAHWMETQPPIAIRARGLKLSHRTLTLRLGSDGVGQGAQLLATVGPKGADGALRWRSSRPDVAGVDGQGAVTPLKLGTAVITCSTGDGSRLKRTVRVTVKKLAPKSIELSDTAMTLVPNGRKALGYTVLPDNACDKRVTFKSSNPSVARVSADGTVTGLKLGRATITVRTRAGKVTARSTVTVGFAESDVYYLAVGQSNYVGQSKLPDCVPDAKRFEKTIRASRMGRSVSGASRLLTDLTGNALRAELQNLSTMGQTPKDITYFYYSGHGASSAQSQAMRGALVGTDSRMISLDELRSYLDAVPGTVVVVLDSCLSGQAIAPKLAGAQSAPASEADRIAFGQRVIDAFKAPSPATAGVMPKALDPLFINQRGKYKIAVASRSLQDSWASGEGYSVFTRFLCEAAGIEGAGIETADMGRMPGDQNRNGYLSLKEAYNYANPRVLRWARQEPWVGAQNMMIWPTNDAFPIFSRVG
ncbi:Ig-like domain-containing protein [Bacillota bacterium Meth-B3]